MRCRNKTTYEYTIFNGTLEQTLEIIERCSCSYVTDGYDLLVPEWFEDDHAEFARTMEGDYLLWIPELWIPENEAYQLLTEEEFNEQFETL